MLTFEQTHEVTIECIALGCIQFCKGVNVKQWKKVYYTRPIAKGIISKMANSLVELLTLDEAESRGWNDMVMNHPLGSVFHHTAYAKVIHANFHHMTPCYVSLIGSDGSCQGGLVLFLVRSWLTGNRLVSIPWAAYGDPLIRTSEEFKLLFMKVLDLCRRFKVTYVEIKSRESGAILKETNLMKSVEYDTAHLLDITQGLDEVWDRLHRSERKQIKKAERNGIKVRLARSEEDIDSFFQLLCRHRRVLGFPAHKLEFYQNMWKYLVPSGLAQFLVAEKEGEVLGGLCNFIFKRTVTLVCIAASGNFRYLGGGPCLYWAAICAASREGLNTVDFGKTPVGVNSLKVFKERWGAEEIEVPVFYYPMIRGVSTYQDEQNLFYRAMRYFWKVTPPRLSRVASSFFWRHTG